MKHFALNFDWVDYGAHDQPLFDATMAHLRITAGGHNIIQVLDKKAKSIRDYVIVPLYPLAEWIVANWWFLLEECEVSSKGIPFQDYLRRHSFRTARDGYALPDIRIFSEGSTAKLEWHSVTTAHQIVDFTGQGEYRMSSSVLARELADFVDSVLARLEAMRVDAAWLTGEWRAVKSTSENKKEVEFCAAAAWLGLDAYDLHEALADRVIALWNDTPVPLRVDLFQASSFAELPNALRWVNAGLERIDGMPQRDLRWKGLLSNAGAGTAARTPWEVGYALARRARAHFKLKNQAPVQIEKLDATPIRFIDAVAPAPLSSIEGLFAFRTKGEASSCYTAKKRAESRRFLAARGLVHQLFGSSARVALLSSANTQRQQRERAFAAEFLAPAQHLKERMRADEITSDEIEDLACEFGVSSLVVEHQIVNHHLARINRH